MRLFDSHAHVQDAAFDPDRDDVIARAWEAGLEGMLVLGTNVHTSEEAIALAQSTPGVYAASGCHPHFAEDMDETALADLRSMASWLEVAVIGEIGLDFYRDLSPREEQLSVFKHHLDIAAKVAKPVAVHCRQAHHTLFPIVRRWSKELGGQLPDGRPLGVMHYFSGTAQEARDYVELGFMISVHCSITYPKSEKLSAVAKEIPLDMLLVETDSPYGAPQVVRGQRNEPANVLAAVERVAELRGEPVERIAEATTDNALRLLDASVETSRLAVAGA